MAPIHEAAFAGNLDEVNRLLEVDPGLLNARFERALFYTYYHTSRLATPLMAAAERCHEPVVRRLLEMGADVGAQDERGWTAAHCAISHRSPQVLALLLEAGIPTEACGPNRKAALMLAADYHSERCMTLLVNHGADVNTR